MAVKVTGGPQLDRVARQLQQAGRRDLMRGLADGMQRAADPLPGVARQGAMHLLPKAGGLAARVARSSIRTEVRAGGNTVTVKVIAEDRMDLPRIDKGRLRHPVYGNRRNWVSQSVPPGWFTRTLLARAPQVRDAIDAALQRVADKIGS